MFVDCDAHIDESIDTWSYIPESKSEFRPAEMDFAEGQIPSHLVAGGKARKGTGVARGLLIDGTLYGRRNRDDVKTQTTVDTRELRDIPGRLKDMDEMGIEYQILFPSTLLMEVTERQEVEIALCESYNRWLADRCAESGGRIRWNAILPLLSMPDALKEMRRVKEAGAVGVFKRGFESGRRRADSEYFFPMYELAQELDMPISIHLGQPYRGFFPAYVPTKHQILNELYVIDSFLALVTSGICQKFPSLRFAFVEASASWLPFALHHCAYTDIHTKGSVLTNELDESGGRFKDLLEEYHLFVTCESIEDLAFTTNLVGDTNLVVGTDYGHADRSAIRYGHRSIMERTDISKEAAKRLTDLNGRRLYGLPAGLE